MSSTTDIPFNRFVQSRPRLQLIVALTLALVAIFAIRTIFASTGSWKTARVLVVDDVLCAPLADIYSFQGTDTMLVVSYEHHRDERRRLSQLRIINESRPGWSITRLRAIDGVGVIWRGGHNGEDGLMLVTPEMQKELHDLSKIR